MFPVFADVPAYPLVFVVFWGAAVDLRPRDGPPPAGLRRDAPAVGQPRPFGQIGARLAGSIEYAFVQTKMFKDSRAGLMHAGIFWGFVLLTIGTANIVTGGLIQTVLSVAARRRALGRDLGDAERRRGDRPRLDRVGVRAAARSRGRARLTLQPRRAADPGDDRRRRRHRAASPRSFEFAALRRPARRVRRRRRSRGRSAVGVRAGDARGRASRSCGGPTSRSSRRSSSTCRSASTSTSRPRSRTSGTASSRRAASCRRWTSSARTRRSG